MTRTIVHYPQDEMNSFLLPVTKGCSYNKCFFCTMYKDQIFEALPLRELELVLMGADRYTEKVFLTGGDPLALGYEELRKILGLVNKYIPFCARVACYASVTNLKKFSLDQLGILHDQGLRFLYIGFESGSDYALALMNKAHRKEEAIREARKLNKAGLGFNSIILTGLAGRGRSLESARETVEMLNSFSSQSIITMNLKIFQGSPLQKMALAGSFELADQAELLDELYYLVENLEVDKETIFDSSHPTNIFKIRGFLPQDRRKILNKLEARRKSI
ncbi:MAG: radical SAM protein [Tissierellia bacterium]|nr:radical SAM protein [Tissierellia bacterium]